MLLNVRSTCWQPASFMNGLCIFWYLPIFLAVFYSNSHSGNRQSVPQALMISSSTKYVLELDINILNRLHNALLIYARQTLHNYITGTQKPYIPLAPYHCHNPSVDHDSVETYCAVKAGIIIRDMLIHTKRLFNMFRKIKVPTQSRPMQPIQSDQRQVHHFATFTLTAQGLPPHKHQSFGATCMLFGRCLYD